MKYRKLRIAWSVTWGVVAVLLCVLWVRSYWRTDRLEKNSTTSHIVITNWQGSVMVAHGNNAGAKTPVWAGWRFSSLPASNLPGINAMGHPYWFLTLVVATVGYLPWIGGWPHRFSLRTLLIAMTLIALSLGAGIVIQRSGAKQTAYALECGMIGLELLALVLCCVAIWKGINRKWPPK